MDLRQEKQRLQEAIRERLARINDQERAAESRSICRRVLDMLPPDAKTICAFVPIKDEVDIRPLLRALIERNIALYLPCFEKKLTFRRATDLSALVPGGLKVPEPPPESDALDPALLDIAIIPGRAFDSAGNRLGRGNGGYDRWIESQRAANPKTRYWGVCFDCQVVSTVPMESHDQPVDAVMTGRGKIDRR